MKKSILKEYASLIVKSGANVQKGQEVVIYASVDDAYFVEFLVVEAYKLKAKKVNVEWMCSEINNLTYKYAKTETLCDVPNWKIEKKKYEAEILPAHIYIESEDPDSMVGIDQKKLMTVNQKVRAIMKPYRDQMENKYQWVIAAIPGKKWAKKVFPELSVSKAMDALWDAILKCSRVDGNALKNWEIHNASLSDKCNKLNNMDIKTLTYKSANGTDFSINLKSGVIFEAGMAKTINGINYNPNIPTEEVFTSPDKLTANGVVYSTKPLSAMGKLVTDFGFRFENGKVVEVIAKDIDHKKTLEELINVDEGAARLGEVALVPFNSPINQTNIIFSNTLFDENACCHLALGKAFPECIKDFDKKNEEEIKSYNLNDSLIHEDFMIGSSDLSIIATTNDGKAIEIFKNGTWAI